MSISRATLPSGVKSISNAACFPLSFDETSPAAVRVEYLRDESIRRLVEFFQAKGLPALKQEDRAESWYQDWLDYQARHGLYASLLSPRRYSSRGHQFDLRSLTRFLEVCAYFSPAHAYSLQVSFLGLFPILLSANEPLKREAIAKLEGGGLFAFAVSEKAHGSDLFANEFVVRPAGPDCWVADGTKYYIGNANAAGIISILARKEDPASADAGRRAPFVFLALRPSEAPALQDVRKIKTLGIRTAFVGEFSVRGHSFPTSDMISQGREAWDAVFGTVDLGKFFLGFGAIGICEHAFAEALTHLRRRVLYGQPVTAMSHIRTATAIAFARLLAMKLYALRALDYLQAAQPDDRRYLLYNAVQKARVSTEGVKVIGLLSECVGARGLESETYFETALRDTQLIPGLEGSTHINFGLTARFVARYFANSTDDGPAPASPEHLDGESGESCENPYWFENRDANAKTVRFAHFLQAYQPLRALPNVGVFMQQVRAFGRFVNAAAASPKPAGDRGEALGIGRCFAIIAYAQLVAEQCSALQEVPATVAIIFQSLIEDLSAEALKLAAMFPAGSPRRALVRSVVRVPKTTPDDVEAVFQRIEAHYGTS